MKHIATLILLHGASSAAADTAGVRTREALLNAPYITGSQYSVRDLMPAYLDQIGQPVTDDALEAIARRVEDMYRRDGFLIPLIVKQAAGGSTPHLHVFEARVADVQVRGDPGAYREAVAAVAAGLRAQPVLHKARTQRAIQELEDLPGLSVRAGFTPRDSDPNAFALTLDVGFERTDGALALSSRVTEVVGEGLLSGRVAFNSVLGTGEAITLSAASSTTFGAYTYLSGRIERRFGALDLDLFAARSQARTGDDSSYDSERFRLEASSLVLRRGGLGMRPLVAMSVRNAGDRDDEGNPWHLTRTRTVEAGVEISGRGDTSITRLRATAERGLDAWNAGSFRRSGDAPHPDFTKIVLDVSHTHAVLPGWQLRAAAEGQWTHADLPSGHRFTYGGASFGRAFDSGAMIADSGMAMSLQLERFRRWNNAWLNYGRAYLQADYAMGGHNDDDATQRRLTAASVSTGVALRSHTVTTTLELGYMLKQVTGEQRDGKKLRAFLGSQYAF